jgi:hypothetical protein
VVDLYIYLDEDKLILMPFGIYYYHIKRKRGVKIMTPSKWVVSQFMALRAMGYVGAGGLIGAAIGSVFPVVGTLAGAAIGICVGALVSAIDAIVTARRETEEEMNIRLKEDSLDEVIEHSDSPSPQDRLIKSQEKEKNYGTAQKSASMESKPSGMHATFSAPLSEETIMKGLTGTYGVSTGATHENIRREYAKTLAKIEAAIGTSPGDTGLKQLKDELKQTMAAFEETLKLVSTKKDEAAKRNLITPVRDSLKDVQSRVDAKLNSQQNVGKSKVPTRR